MKIFITGIEVLILMNLTIFEIAIIRGIYVSLTLSLFLNTKISNKVFCFVIYDRVSFKHMDLLLGGMFVCLFGVFRPTREFFSHLETSPLPVKDCKF